MRKILATTFAIMFALILLSPTMGYSFQAGNTLKSAIHNYTIGIEMPSHQPAVVVTRMPYSLKYEDLFQPEAMQIGKTATSSIIGLATSANITPVHAQTRASTKPASIGWSITSLSGKYVANLTNNMTALNLARKMMLERTRNMTFPSNVTSSFKVTPQ